MADLRPVQQNTAFVAPPPPPPSGPKPPPPKASNFDGKSLQRTFDTLAQNLWLQVRNKEIGPATETYRTFSNQAQSIINFVIEQATQTDSHDLYNESEHTKQSLIKLVADMKTTLGPNAQPQDFSVFEETLQIVKASIRRLCSPTHREKLVRQSMFHAQTGNLPPIQEDLPPPLPEDDALDLPPPIDDIPLPQAIVKNNRKSRMSLRLSVIQVNEALPAPIGTPDSNSFLDLPPPLPEEQTEHVLLDIPLPPSLPDNFDLNQESAAPLLQASRASVALNRGGNEFLRALQNRAENLREISENAQPARAPKDNTDLVSLLSQALNTRRNKIDDDENEEEEDNDLEWLDD